MRIICGVDSSHPQTETLLKHKNFQQEYISLNSTKYLRYETKKVNDSRQLVLKVFITMFFRILYK